MTAVIVPAERVYETARKLQAAGHRDVVVSFHENDGYWAVTSGGRRDDGDEMHRHIVARNAAWEATR